MNEKKSKENVFLSVYSKTKFLASNSINLSSIRELVAENEIYEVCNFASQ